MISLENMTFSISLLESEEKEIKILLDFIDFIFKTIAKY